MPLLPSDICNDIIDFFPTLLDRGIYYQLLLSYKEKTMLTPPPPTTNDACNNNAHDPIIRELKWKIPFTTLKQLNSLERDWSSSNITSSQHGAPTTATNSKWKLHHMPDILLEKPIFFNSNVQGNSSKEEGTSVVKKWDWKEKSKLFPIIESSCNPIHCIKHHTCHLKKLEKRKIQFNASVIQTVALLDQSLHNSQQQQMSNEEMIKQLTKSRAKQCQYSKTILLQKKKNTSHLGTFLPQKRLDDFRMIQRNLQQQGKKNINMGGNRGCELDQYRFKFD